MVIKMGADAAFEGDIGDATVRGLFVLWLRAVARRFPFHRKLCAALLSALEPEHGD